MHRRNVVGFLDRQDRHDDLEETAAGNVVQPPQSNVCNVGVHNRHFGIIHFHLRIAPRVATLKSRADSMQAIVAGCRVHLGEVNGSTFIYAQLHICEDGSNSVLGRGIAPQTPVLTIGYGGLTTAAKDCFLAQSAIVLRVRVARARIFFKDVYSEVGTGRIGTRCKR